MIAWKEAIEGDAKRLNALTSLNKPDGKEKLPKRKSEFDPTVRFGLPETAQKEPDCAILKSYFNFEAPNVKIILYADK